VIAVFDDLSDPFRVSGGGRWGLRKSASRRDAVAMATKIYRHCMRASHGVKQMTETVVYAVGWFSFEAARRIDLYIHVQAKDRIYRSELYGHCDRLMLVCRATL